MCLNECVLCASCVCVCVCVYDHLITTTCHAIFSFRMLMSICQDSNKTYMNVCVPAAVDMYTFA